MSSRVLELSYNGIDTLRIDLEGHPTDVIDHARVIAGTILSDSRWAIVSIEGKLANNALMPSEMKFFVVAERR